MGGVGRSKATPSALVIGLGNRLRGDDGLGPAVIDRLRSRLGDHACVTLLESAGGDLAEHLARDEFRRVIVVDAAELQRPAGSWARIEVDDLARPAAGHPARLSHGFGLTDSLALLTALAIRPAPVVMYAVQPGRLGWGTGLSASVLAAVGQVAAAIAEDLDRLRPRRRRRGRWSKGRRTSVPIEPHANVVWKGREESHGESPRDR